MLVVLGKEETGREVWRVNTSSGLARLVSLEDNGCIPLIEVCAKKVVDKKTVWAELLRTYGNRPGDRAE